MIIKEGKIVDKAQKIADEQLSESGMVVAVDLGIPDRNSFTIIFSNGRKQIVAGRVATEMISDYQSDQF